MPRIRLQRRQRVAMRQRFDVRLVVAAGCLALVAGVSVFLAGNFGAPSVSKGAPGKHGAKTISSGTVILNEFTTLSTTVSAGATAISVASSSLNANSRFSGNLSAGELILIIQMQGATINTGNTSNFGQISNYNNSGKYEFAEVSSVPNSSTINLTAPLKNAYTSTGKVQIVRVPRYTTLTLNSGATISTDDWAGTKGGIIAIEVTGTSSINGTINVTGKGFRGGVVETNSNIPGDHSSFRSTSAADGAEKGESIAGYQADYSTGRYGRGAPANGGGGGNSHNASGGGGANAGDTSAWNGLGNPDTSVAAWKNAWNLEAANFSRNVSTGGGRGGYTYSQSIQNPLTFAPGNAGWGGDGRYNVGGYGGRPLNYSTGRIFFGGGGGAGDNNDGTGTSGADGGGIIFMNVGGNLSGSGTIKANGANGTTTTSPLGWDGSGGGGGGGTVIVYAKNASISNITIQAFGGTGGSQYLIGDDEAEGTGGGGGGGYVALTNKTNVTIDVSGGSSGSTNSTTMPNFTPNGGTKGYPGMSNGTAPTNPYSGVSTLPVELISFNVTLSDNAADVKWATASERENDFFTIERSADGITFEDIGKIKGYGTTSSRQYYAFHDNAPLSGTSYYRLKQTDFNGASETFKPLPLLNTLTQLKGLLIKSISPNPFEKEFDVQFTNDSKKPVLIQIFALNGQLISKEEILSEEGNNYYHFLSPDNMIAGIYLFTAIPEGEKPISIKILKK